MLLPVSNKMQTYSQDQQFTYACKDHVFHGSFQFQWFLQLSFFCNGMNETQTILSQRIFMKFGSIMDLLQVLWKIWPNLLAQKYTYIYNYDIELNVPWPF